MRVLFDVCTTPSTDHTASAALHCSFVVQSGDRCEATNCRESNHSNEILVRVSSVDAWRWKGKHSMAHLVNSLSYISGAYKLTEKYLDSATQTDWRHVIICTTISGRFWLHHFSHSSVPPPLSLFLTQVCSLGNTWRSKERTQKMGRNKTDLWANATYVFYNVCAPLYVLRLDAAPVRFSVSFKRYGKIKIQSKHKVLIH